MARRPLTRPRRSRAELDALLARLPQRIWPVCGHMAPSAGDYYDRSGTKHGESCLTCWRARERDRQRSYRGGATPATLRTVGHAPRDAVVNDEEVQAALGVLRDHRAQRRGRSGFVYLIGETEEWYAVKVGYSVKPEARAGELQTGNPRPLRLLASMPGTEEDERTLHAKYAESNILGEWFEAGEALLAEFGIERKEDEA